MKLTGLFGGQWPATILFDLDGTLVDSAPDLAAGIDGMLRSLGRPPAGEERVREWVGNGAGVLVRRALAGRADYEQGPEVTEGDFNRALDLFYTAYTTENGKNASVYPGVKAFLKASKAQGCRLGIVTNKPHAFTAPLLELMGLAHWFGHSVSGDTLATRKPDAAPIHHAIAQLGGEQATTLMVGDSVTDVRAAQNAGIPAVAVRYGYNYGVPVDDLGADIVVDSLTELL
jgi:phosphoglycolate phosphatase